MASVFQIDSVFVPGPGVLLVGAGLEIAHCSPPLIVACRFAEFPL